MRIPAPWNSIRATLDRLRATARAEVAAVDIVPADYNFRLGCIATAEDFYKPNTPVICAAHIVGIADPAMHRGKHTEDKPSKRTKVGDMALGHESQQAIEFRNCQLKHQRAQERWEVTLRHDAGKSPSNVGESRDLKVKLKDQICAIQADRRNAQDTLAYERATFHADCAAFNVRTTEDAERAWIRFAVARAEVARQEI